MKSLEGDREVKKLKRSEKMNTQWERESYKQNVWEKKWKRGIDDVELCKSRDSDLEGFGEVKKNSLVYIIDIIVVYTLKVWCNLDFTS